MKKTNLKLHVVNFNGMYYYGIKLQEYWNDDIEFRTKLTSPRYNIVFSDITISDEQAKANQYIVFMNDDKDQPIPPIPISTPRCYNKVVFKHNRLFYNASQEAFVLLDAYMQQQQATTTAIEDEGFQELDIVDGANDFNSGITPITVKLGTVGKTFPDFGNVKDLEVEYAIEESTSSAYIVNPIYAINDRMATTEDLFVEFYINQSNNCPIIGQEYYLYAPQMWYCPTKKEIESNTFKIKYMSEIQQDLFNNLYSVSEFKDKYGETAEATNVYYLSGYSTIAQSYMRNVILTNIRSWLSYMHTSKGLGTMDVNSVVESTTLYDIFNDMAYDDTTYNTTSSTTFTLKGISNQRLYIYATLDYMKSMLQYIENNVQYRSGLDKTTYMFYKQIPEDTSNATYRPNDGIYQQLCEKADVLDENVFDGAHKVSYMSTYAYIYLNPSSIVQSNTTNMDTFEYHDVYYFSHNPYLSSQMAKKIYFLKAPVSGTNTDNTQSYDMRISDVIDYCVDILTCIYNNIILEANTVTLKDLSVNTRNASNSIDLYPWTYKDNSLVRMCDISKSKFSIQTFEGSTTNVTWKGLHGSNMETTPNVVYPPIKDATLLSYARMMTPYAFIPTFEDNSKTYASNYKDERSLYYYNARYEEGSFLDNNIPYMPDTGQIYVYYDALGNQTTKYPMFKIYSYDENKNETIYRFDPGKSDTNVEVIYDPYESGDVVKRYSEEYHLMMLAPISNNVSPYIKTYEYVDAISQVDEDNNILSNNKLSLSFNQYPKMYLIEVTLYQVKFSNNIYLGKEVQLDSVTIEGANLRQFTNDEVLQNIYFNGDNTRKTTNHRKYYLLTDFDYTYIKNNRVYMSVNYTTMKDDNGIYATNNDVYVQCRMYGPFSNTQLLVETYLDKSDVFKIVDFGYDFLNPNEDLLKNYKGGTSSNIEKYTNLNLSNDNGAQRWMGSLSALSVDYDHNKIYSNYTTRYSFSYPQAMQNVNAYSQVNNYFEGTGVGFCEGVVTDGVFNYRYTTPYSTAYRHSECMYNEIQSDYTEGGDWSTKTYMLSNQTQALDLTDPSYSQVFYVVGNATIYDNSSDSYIIKSDSDLVAISTTDFYVYIPKDDLSDEDGANVDYYCEFDNTPTLQGLHIAFADSDGSNPYDIDELVQETFVVRFHHVNGVQPKYAYCEGKTGAISVNDALPYQTIVVTYTYNEETKKHTADITIE